MKYYIVETPQASLTWQGGPLQPSACGGVWLTTHDGRPVFQVDKHYVKEVTRAEVEARLIAERRATR